MLDLSDDVQGIMFSLHTCCIVTLAAKRGSSRPQPVKAEQLLLSLAPWHAECALSQNPLPLATAMTLSPAPRPCQLTLDVPWKPAGLTPSLPLAAPQQPLHRQVWSAFHLINTSLPGVGRSARISFRITTVTRVARYHQMNYNWFIEPCWAVQLMSGLFRLPVLHSTCVAVLRWMPAAVMEESSPILNSLCMTLL